MYRKSGTPIPESILPEGYSFVNFSAGDEHHWAEIEASVGEFTSKDNLFCVSAEFYILFTLSEPI